MDHCEGGWVALWGESWCQMSISFINHGHLARTLSYHWTVNVALCGEKSFGPPFVIEVGGQEPWCRAALRCSGRLMSVCSCTLKYQGGMATLEATCAMHKNWLTRVGHILRMRNCGSARYLFFSARLTLSSARNDHYRARYAVLKRRNP